MTVTTTKPEGQPPEKTGASVPTTSYLNPLMNLRGDIDRLFDSVLAMPFGRRIFELDPFRRMGSMLAASYGEIEPKVDVRETAEAFEIMAELPGIDEKDIAVTVSDGVLTLKGEKKTEREEAKGDWHLSERSYGAFRRVFRVPEAVDQDKIAATFEKGVLVLTLPKVETAKKTEKKIEVQTKA